MLLKKRRFILEIHQIMTFIIPNRANGIRRAIRDIAVKNLLPFSEKFEMIRETSLLFLRSGRLADGSVDVAYIDGSHRACDVLTDAVLSWPLLKVGGMIVFDDNRRRRRDAESPNASFAVDAFKSCFAGSCETVVDGVQAAFAKKS